MATTSQNSDIEIKQVDEIVAIEILKNTYSFNCLQYTKAQLEEMVNLLTQAKEYKDLSL